MPKSVPPAPTDGELALLRVLWDHGPCTVRQVHDHLGRGTAYTTALKLLQIMAEKGLVLRNVANRTHIYSAAQPAQQTQRLLLKETAGQSVRWFGGQSGFAGPFGQAGHPGGIGGDS